MKRIAALILLLVIVIGLVILSPATVVDRFFRLEKISHRRILKEMRKKGNKSNRLTKTEFYAILL